jgi:hypothetical protein
MRWLKKLPGFQRSPAGREWLIWKRLPMLLCWGTAVPALLALVLYGTAPDGASAIQEREMWLRIYQLLGLVVLHWTLVLTLAIGCAIVMVMKGPAYVADAYPPPEREA